MAPRHKSSSLRTADASLLSRLVAGLPSITEAPTRAAVLQHTVVLAVQVLGAGIAEVAVDDGAGHTERYASPRPPGPPAVVDGPRLEIALPARGVLHGTLTLTRGTRTPWTPEEKEGAIVLTGWASHTLDRLTWEAERRQLLASHDRLLDALGHDLGNALTAIYGWGELLIRRRDPAGVPLPAYEMLEATEGAIGLVHDMVDLTRLERDELIPAKAAANAAEVLINVVSRCEAAARTHGVTMVVASPDPAAEVVTDRRRLEQLLVHLLGAAVRSAWSGGEVRVACMVGDETATFQVEVIRSGSAPLSAWQREDAEGHPDRGLPLWTRLGEVIGARIEPQFSEGVLSGYRVSLPAAVSMKVSS